MTLAGIASVLLAYLLGSIPLGTWLGRLRRSTALGAADKLLVLVLTVAKGYGSIWLVAAWTRADPTWMGASAVATLLGDAFPIYLQVRGGMGIATGAGTFAYFTPWAILSVLAVWLLVVVAWRYVSLGSILASAAYPVFSYVLYRPALPLMLAGVVAACLIILRHEPNIRRLVAGIEPKVTFRRQR